MNVVKICFVSAICLLLVACNESNDTKPKSTSETGSPKPVAGFDSSKLTPCQRSNTCSSALQIRDELKAMALENAK